MDHLMSIDHGTVPEIDGSSGRTIIHTVHLNDFGENVTNHRTTIADWFFSMAISVFRFSSTMDGPKWNYDLMEKLIFLLSLLGKLLLPSCVMDIWQHESEETKKKKKWIRAELRDPSIRTSTTMMSRRKDAEDTAADLGVALSLVVDRPLLPSSGTIESSSIVFQTYT